MNLKTCLTLSMIAALSAAATCPAGFTLSCCITFQTQADQRYLRGVDCEFAVRTPTSLRAKILLGVQPYQECPCPPGRTYRFCCVSATFLLCIMTWLSSSHTQVLTKRNTFTRSQGALGCSSAPPASSQCAQCTRTATLTTTSVYTYTPQACTPASRSAQLPPNMICILFEIHIRWNQIVKDKEKRAELHDEMQGENGQTTIRRMCFFYLNLKKVLLFLLASLH